MKCLRQDIIVSDLSVYDLHAPKRLANCKFTQITVQSILTKNFLPEHSSVVKVLTACCGTHNADVNCV